MGQKANIFVQSLFSSGNLNDGKAAIPLLKKIDPQDLPAILEDGLFDATEVMIFKAVYQQVMHQNAQAIIANNPRKEREAIGYDKQFAPTCVRENSYRNDSYDCEI